MSETLIQVDGVSKKFCRSLRRSLRYGLQDLGNELRGRRHGGDGRLRPEEFWAVKDVSFELKRGERLGLIGRNGAGKTTLLRILNGLIKPDQGRVELRGRVGALIALGAGFNPILTGRENIYVSASILGLSKKAIDAKLDEIVDFAEIGEFIDMPIQSYSSGMNVRLGFSVATALEPDILILDEVLAVGDIGFQIKCLNRVRRMAADSAVIFVSHSMQYVSAFCTRATLMDHGRVAIDSTDVAEAIQRYYSLSQSSEQISGDGGACVEEIELIRDGRPVKAEVLTVDQGETVELALTVRVEPAVTGVTMMLGLLDAALNGIVSFPALNEDGSDALFGPGVHRLRIPLGSLELNAGAYSFLVGLREKDSRILLLRHQGLLPFLVSAPDASSSSKIVRPVQVQRMAAS